jgi:hypothetical protein
MKKDRQIKDLMDKKKLPNRTPQCDGLLPFLFIVILTVRPHQERPKRQRRFGRSQSFAANFSVRFGRSSRS